MTDKRVITGPFLDSMELPANGVLVVTGTSPTDDGAGGYVSVAPYVVQVANGDPFLADGTTPWSLPVTGAGQAFEILMRWQAAGAVDATRVQVPERKRIVSVPAGTSPIAFINLPDTTPVVPGSVFVDAQAVLDAYTAAIAAQTDIEGIPQLMADQVTTPSTAFGVALSATTVMPRGNWMAATAYPKNSLVINAGATWLAVAAVPARATFTAADWQAMGGGGGGALVENPAGSGLYDITSGSGLIESPPGSGLYSIGA